MARYRKIETRIWNDAKFTSLSERAKLVFLFLLTHPNLTMIGAMRASVPGLAAELGVDGFRKAFEEVLAMGMARHDEKASFVWLPNFLKYNRPESPNVIRAWPEALEMLPECHMKIELGRQLTTSAEGLTQAFQEAFREVFPKHNRNQEQQQEQEQNQQQERSNVAAVSPLAPPASGLLKHRGTRIPEDFAITDAHREFARENSLPAPDLHLAEFLDYWRAQPGSKGCKQDWDATFRNWLRRAFEFGNANRGNYGKNRAEQRKQANLSAAAQAIAAIRGGA